LPTARSGALAKALASGARPHYFFAMATLKKDIEPDIDLADDGEEPSLPPADDENAADAAESDASGLAAGRAAIAALARHAPAVPGVYRMIDRAGEVLYVGKAKNIKKRILAYTRPTGHHARIDRMIAATANLEFVSTATETEALLLEANLIKRLRPRFNVLMRDDKSFPYILITGDHAAPQIMKHRGARTRTGDYFGPFASAQAVHRTLTALERAFLLRSCSDTVYESRTRPCLLHQIKRCAAPCTGEIALGDYAELVREAKAFLAGKSQAVREQLAREMEQAADALDFERAAAYRDRLAALSAVQAHQGINPRSVAEADVFAVHQQGGYTCIEVFFFRTGQNWGNRAYFPKADRSLSAPEVLASFLAQFYDDKPCPCCVLISQDIADRALLAEALTTKSGYRVEVAVPQRGEKKELVDHALANAREALGRKLAESASQQRLLAALTDTLGLARVPRRIEVYDNSHIQGSNAVGAMIVAGPEGFRKNQYRKFNVRAAQLAPGDDYGMMREVLMRRFKRLLAEAPRAASAAVPDVADAETAAPRAFPPPLWGRDREGGPSALHEPGIPHPTPPSQGGREQAVPADTAHVDPTGVAYVPDESDGAESPWPDLVLIDGGPGQLAAARETLAGLGVTDVPLVAIAKGPERDAGNETLHMPGRAPFRLKPRDPVLHFVERLRDEAHRFAVGSHRQRRKRDIREAGLQEIAGIGPTRKRALLHHFGTLKAIERASPADLAAVPGINAETARRIYDFFHEKAG
jgi:excinuclease ABC subunit C